MSKIFQQQLVIVESKMFYGLEHLECWAATDEGVTPVNLMLLVLDHVRKQRRSVKGVCFHARVGLVYDESGNCDASVWVSAWWHSFSSQRSGSYHFGSVYFPPLLDPLAFPSASQLLFIFFPHLYLSSPVFKYKQIFLFIFIQLMMYLVYIINHIHH